MEFIKSPVARTYLDWLTDLPWSNSSQDSIDVKESKNILDEVDKREILCYGGIEVSTLPESDSSDGENGTVFPSPDPSLIPEAIPDKMTEYSY